MLVRVLGPLEAELDGRRLAVGGGRLRALLARLALAAGRPVTSGALVDAVWDDALPADQVHALQSLVSRLRRSLGDADLVAPAPGGYRLAAEVDAQRFEELAREGGAALAAGRHEHAAGLLREALALWRGPALGDLLDYRFAAAAAARLEDLRLTALADRVQADLALGRGDRLVPELEALCAEHPLHERLAAQLIAALAAAGRQADALAAYERVRARLAEELGVPPSGELQAAHLAVLRGQERPVPARSNLPAPVSRFVGRAREIEQIGALLGQHRLVTLVGPGGAGKTRLAQEALAGWVERMADGVWMVELAPVTAEVEVVPAVLGALGVREAPLSERALATRDGLERLLDVLAAREAILVLDNCEHLIGAVAQLVERLLGACPRLRVVATSREALAIAGESLAPVPPLGLPEPGASALEAILHPAVELFADRAAAAQPGFAVDETTVGTVVEICRRLDGLPLALELAAARLRSLPLAELAAGLDDRFRLLTGGSRTALPRHRTLRAVVDWSWELLSDDERALARRLAVFPAGVTAESAPAVGGDLDGLAALADRSLLQVVAEAVPTRYRMLETLREYGLERLAEAGELEEARDAHARHFAALVATAEPCLRGPDQREWFARLSDERENVLAALRHLGDAGDARGALRLAVDLLWFWLLSGSQEEALTWLGFALAVKGDRDPEDDAVATSVRALAELDQADEAELRATLARTLERLEPVDARHRPLVALARPVLAAFMGDEECGRAYEAAAEAHPDPWVRAAVHVLRAAQAENDGDVERTSTALTAAHAAFTAVGDAWGLAVVLVLESGRLMVEGELEAARRALADAQVRLAGLGPQAGGGMLDVRMAEILLRLGDLDGARERAQRTLARADLARDDGALAAATLARIAWAAGDLEGARMLVDGARERLPVSRSQGHGQALLEAMAATVDAQDGAPARAAQRLATAHAAAVGTRDMPVVAIVGVAAAAVAQAAGRREEAAELLGAAAAVRGAEDLTSVEVARLRDDADADAYARGRALPRADALARIEAAVSRAAPVGP